MREVYTSGSPDSLFNFLVAKKYTPYFINNAIKQQLLMINNTTGQGDARQIFLKQKDVITAEEALLAAKTFYDEERDYALVLNDQQISQLRNLDGFLAEYYKAMKKRRGTVPVPLTGDANGVLDIVQFLKELHQSVKLYPLWKYYYWLTWI